MSEVVVVRWPEGREGVAELLRAGAAVLYLIAPDADPPPETGCLEDWVRMPGDERDLLERLAALERRAAVHRSPPSVDGDGFLHYQGRLVHLSPDEARLAAALVARFDEVVSDRDLLARTASRRAGTASRLRNEVAHLRARLRPVHLTIRRVRGRGYKLHGS